MNRETDKDVNQINEVAATRHNEDDYKVDCWSAKVSSFRGDRTHVEQFWFSPIFGEVFFEKRVLLISHETTFIYAPPDFFLDF